jgi:hypothetical protein
MAIMESKIKTFINNLSLSDIYKILDFPTILYRTGKSRSHLSLFALANSYNKHKESFYGLLEIKRQELILQEANQSYILIERSTSEIRNTKFINALEEKGFIVYKE